MYNNFFNSMQRNNNSFNANRNTTNNNHNVQNSQGNNASDSSDMDFMHNSRLSGIDPVKLKIIMEIREKSKNKSIEELLPEIMKINQELNRRNMNFNKNETNLLMEVIEESLSPAERQKFNMFKSFLG